MASMSSSDEELAAFWAARLDEDETMAVATSPSETRLTWEVDAGDAPARYCVISAGDVAGVAEALALERATGAAVARHIARHDPARMLREVQAGRKLLLFHDVDRHGSGTCVNCFDVFGRHLPWPCPTARIAVAVWSDHPDYRQEWKP